MRYGARREAEATLIFVTEPLDGRTLVKDDDAPVEHRVNALKLNFALRFQTGIYPYGVFTSVFSPVDAFDGARFDPAKITFSEQDWCGQSFVALWPDRDAFVEASHSYFPAEGDRSGRTPIPLGALYEDALYIQLRELDGPFAGGERFSGPVVRSLWHARRDHVAIAALEASIERTEREDRVIFVLRRSDGYERTFEIGTGPDHPLLAFRSSDGDDFQLVARTRLPYWQLHDPGDEVHRLEIGLPTGLEIAAPPRTVEPLVPPPDGAP